MADLVTWQISLGAPVLGLRRSFRAGGLGGFTV